jgi:hypothetical protein
MKISNFRPICLATILILSIIGSVDALSVVPRDFNQLVARAETIFKGTATQQYCTWKGEGEARRIVTLVTFRVEETYKGQDVSTLEIELLGGTVGDERLEIGGMPKFSIGDTYVLFVVNNGRQICPLVGVFQGQFLVENDQGNGTERILAHDRTPVYDTAALGKLDTAEQPHSNSSAHHPSEANSARDFRDQILQKAREQAEHPNPSLTED